MQNNQPTLLETLFHSRIQLPSLPTLVVELIENFNNENINVSGLIDKISRDQAVVARVMRLANSPFYGFPGGVGSIREAVLLLGLNDVRSLVIATALMSLSPAHSKVFDWPKFWSHGFGVGVCARKLAEKTQQNQETAFLLGIVHDIGRLVVGVCLPEQFIRVLEYQQAHGMPLTEAEQVILGINHAGVGAAMARHWRFPNDICCAIEEHHNPVPTHRTPLTDIIYIAELLYHNLKPSAPGMEISAFPAFLIEETHMRLNLGQKALEQTIEQIEQQNLDAMPT